MEKPRCSSQQLKMTLAYFVKQFNYYLFNKFSLSENSQSLILINDNYLQYIFLFIFKNLQSLSIFIFTSVPLWPFKQWKWHITNHPFPSVGNTHHCPQQSFSTLETWASKIIPSLLFFPLLSPLLCQRFFFFFSILFT